MDIRCPKCGEPWDMDTAHDVVEDNSLIPEPRPMTVGAMMDRTPRTYSAVLADFRRRGCPAFGGTCSEPSTDTDRTWGLRPQDAAAVLFDVLGDDTDGVAAMLEDMGF